MMLSITAHAFDATTKPINITIPFAAGGGMDQTFRHMQKYSEHRGINLVPNYKPGAEGLIGMNDITGLPTDGYSLGICTAGTVALQRVKNPSADTVIISGIRTSVFGIAVNANSNIYNIKDLENKMRTGRITFGQGAATQKILLEQLIEFSKPKSDVVIAAYKGGGPAIQDLLGGHIDLVAVPLTALAVHVDSGKLRLIALTSKGRLEAYPEVPSIFASYPKWQNYDGSCLIAPKDINPEALKFWSSFMKDYVNDVQVRKDLAKEFTEVSAFGTQQLELTIKASMQKLK